ncbi:MAG: flagellar protein FlaG [Candidatus Thiodiazotropha sp.]|nr:flagellar protein FlaG [Candidatus Thiodiazotropha sp.]MCM8882506.1 flagellar protein FlaG [Candidatus Thiodiazotropha sp.]MCM8922133.1 flagellar protein FlaG [Candidatus Thiodiazotropha sp.]MCU7874524.1 flagellar protein FlaG [Candidatus Thiodiazotropha sp. (ex Lucinoma borealis)]
MPNVITNLAHEYAYKREVSKADASPSVQQAERKESANTEQPQQVVDSKALISKIENLSQLVKRNLEFSIDEDTGQQVVKVIDSDTGELVRQIPPEHLLHVISQVQESREEMIPGVLLDDRV